LANFAVFQEKEPFATKTLSMYRLVVPPGLVQVNVTTPETMFPAPGLVIVTGPGVGVAVGTGVGGFGVGVGGLGVGIGVGVGGFGVGVGAPLLTVTFSEALPLKTLPAS